jgi:hypothetical protein
MYAFCYVGWAQQANKMDASAFLMKATKDDFDPTGKIYPSIPPPVVGEELS